MSWLRSFWKALNTPQTGGGSDSATPLNNFTPRAQQVLALARREADRFNHNFVGTEHLLLGLVALGQGTAVNVLMKMGVDLQNVRLEVEKQVGTGPDQKMVGSIPYTPRVRKVLALAAKESMTLNHTYVGTEHILLGLLREGDGVAARVLKHLHVDMERTRQEILMELDPNFEPPSAVTAEKTGSATPLGDSIDIAKRYDVYCAERNQEIVVYRNVLFKGRRSLFRDQSGQYDIFYEFLELELADGQTIFVGRSSIIKFCEHGVTPSPETLPNKKP